MLEALMVLTGLTNLTLLDVTFLLTLLSLLHFPIRLLFPLLCIILFSNSLPSPKPISKSSISQLFYDSLALSAWKTTGFSTWSLRVNPSSGNLHPTEAYIISPAVDSVCDSAFVAHYAPKEHSLELRAKIPDTFLPSFFPSVEINGERAFRYCNHDVGHAIAAISLAAAELGWDVKLLDGLGSKELERLMGLGIYQGFRIPDKPIKFPEIEFEHPDCVLVVFPNGVNDFKVDYKELSLSDNGIWEFRGNPNSLSKKHVCWDVIYTTAEAVKKPLKIDDRFLVDKFQSSGVCSEGSYKGFSAREIIRKEEECGRYWMELLKLREIQFIRLCCIVLPSGCGSGEKQKRQLALPFRALSWDAEFCLVHRVVGLPKGLYFLVRNEDHLDELKKSTRAEFKWEKPEGCPDDLPLYELARGDCQQIATQLSCHQDIASDEMLQPWYARVHGCILDCFGRLEFMARFCTSKRMQFGISATGIGCFFDDPVHENLGLRGSSFQSLYHFTVGGPVLDKRIMNLPAYPGPSTDA
ncbi:LOW QUALITY PROTEIN: hypothetical protein NC653_004896 [Populus alba x Populus x berolinensis]|uniref:Nitroreductase domain-containing protein n=1 Tax=Populus alba x Populus x berolinensis TaxID=444605 RepID=A0AAD6WB70_9ROSI|nr:LOW QUALITY PROTEIN: hypothetical protein NC653_004896 [Populus alba x Populus x berolinensis]